MMVSEITVQLVVLIGIPSLTVSSLQTADIADQGPSNQDLHRLLFCYWFLTEPPISKQ